MRFFSRRGVIVSTLFFITSVLFAVEPNRRFALIIGNSQYEHIETLVNPANDASDVAAKLRQLGFQVELKQDVRNAEMGRAIDRYVRQLSSNPQNEGFFWYAGHGVQVAGENYLLPVDIDAKDTVDVMYSSYPLNRLLLSFEQTARNKLNVVILDACRNNPFRNTASSNRSLSRGLTTVEHLPQDLFVLFSTAAGAVAADGERGRRNSPFAEAFLKYMNSGEPLSLVVSDITRETLKLTGQKQRPFQQGSIISDKYYSLNPGGTAPSPGVLVANPITPPPVTIPSDLVWIQGGSFIMGSPGTEGSRDADEVQHRVQVKDFYLGKYEITVGEFRQFVNTTGYRTTAETSGGGWIYTNGTWQEKKDANWKNPYFSQQDDQPVVLVSWYDAVQYSNWRSVKEGLTPAYRINGETITWDRSANGYRLPTEAEWEYACRATTSTAFSTGNSITTNYANYDGNSAAQGTNNPNPQGISRKKTTAVGSFAANAWGLYDMHGNVWEWCWDWYGSYGNGAQSDPVGAFSGMDRVIRGGGWLNYGQYLRSANRGSTAPVRRLSYLGFRLLRPRS
ncbi:MAG: SUMF1/EgtB/PvdO family nonheme iron enzyme [Treponema sp.]|jgi:formylglycine-generating enzyme required for sulfatase activity|nr:SUMF1/EgtB/PvdO family nonheme iron enzyme [Treponema sp.]